jgi:hypothetical protein
LSNYSISLELGIILIFVPVMISVRSVFASKDINGFGPHARKVPSAFKAIPNSDRYLAPVPAPVIETRLVGVCPGSCIAKVLSNSIVK